MQIVLNRKPKVEYAFHSCIITVFGKPIVLAFYTGILFKSITALESVLKYPLAKINNRP